MLTHTTVRDFAGAELPVESRTEVSAGFHIAIEGFDGPFDLLLTLIQRHELDITEVSLSYVTDEFISYIGGFSDSNDAGLNHASEFLEVAATLLDMKIARLLPQGEVVDSEDVASLEARDLLFARLLQYRAYSRVSRWFAERSYEESHRLTRNVSVPKGFRLAPTQLEWNLSLSDFAELAETVFLGDTRETSPQGVSTEHIHEAPVSLREQAVFIVEQLQRNGSREFHELISGETRRSVIVARFLVLLELYRGAALELTQRQPLATLTVTWVAAEWSTAQLSVFGDANE